MNSTPIVKVLTQRHKDNLCSFWKKNKCIGCPLQFILFGYNHCYKDIEEINKAIEKFLCTEINSKQMKVATNNAEK